MSVSLALLHADADFSRQNVAVSTSAAALLWATSVSAAEATATFHLMMIDSLFPPGGPRPWSDLEYGLVG